MLNWKLLTISLGLLGLLACNGGDSDETDAPADTTPDDTDDEDDEDTGEAPLSMPFAFTVNGTFALIDGVATSYTVDDGTGPQTQDPLIAIRLIDGDTQDANACDIVLSAVSDVAEADWSVANAESIFGISAPSDAVVADDCMNWDLTNIGGVDGLLSTFAFGLAIDDALHDSTKTQLKASVTADQWDALEPALFGAGWHHGGASIDGSEYSDGGFGFGYEIDANGAVEFDGSGQPTYVPGDQISATRNGAYVLQNTMFLLAE